MFLHPAPINVARIRWTLVAALALFAQPLSATVIRNGFESPEPSWLAAGGDASARVEVCQRTADHRHEGRLSEHWRVFCKSGSTAYVALPIAPSRVIDELQVSLWLRADRPGMQLMARIVLPRSVDPRTKQPVQVLVRGAGYTRTSGWQQLTLKELPKLLDRELRVLRAQKIKVDEREAYLDHVIVNVYGGEGFSSVWLDELEVLGAVHVELAADSAIVLTGANEPVARDGGSAGGSAVDGSANTSGPSGVDRLPAIDGSPRGASRYSTTATPGPRGAVQLSASGLSVGGKPFFPRMIEHRGEPLSVLRDLGCNTVLLSASPTPQQLAQAADTGLWLVAPPPKFAAAAVESPSERARFETEYQAVLAWTLGFGLSERRIEATRLQVKQLRAVDRASRPIVGDAESELRLYSRMFDIVFPRKAPLGTTMELADYAAYLRERPTFARPGTPLWTCVQTEFAPELIQQTMLLGASSPSQPQLAQIRALAQAAVASGCRGIAFGSTAPLDLPDPATVRRRATIELLNFELELLEPWAASSLMAAAADTADMNLSAVVLQTQRARVLLTLPGAPRAQLVCGGPGVGPLPLVAPGVPESSDAYELSPVGLRPVVRKRVAGGLRIGLTERERGSPVLLTQDAAVVTALSRRAAAMKRRVSELELQLADLELQTARIALPANDPAFAQADKQLTESRKQASTGDYAAAYLQARTAHAGILIAERKLWEAESPKPSSSSDTPLARTFATIVPQRQLGPRIAALNSGVNRLAGGDFEDLSATVQAGWRHYEHASTGVQAEVEFSPAFAHSGKLALRLVACDPRAASSVGQTSASPAKSSAKQPPPAVESPPVWIVSPSIPVARGQVIVVRGFVRLTAPIAGSVDGLMIFDTLGGQPLAERIREASTWQPFQLVRAGDGRTPLSITFALSGLGEAYIDDVHAFYLEAGTPLAGTGTPLAGAGTPLAGAVRPVTANISSGTANLPGNSRR